MTERYGQVALPLPLARPYTYRIPEAIADRIEPGARVVVPVRGREMVGIVVGVAEVPPDARRRRSSQHRFEPAPTSPRSRDLMARLRGSACLGSPRFRPRSGDITGPGNADRYRSPGTRR
jgi:primosomal protein N'